MRFSAVLSILACGSVALAAAVTPDTLARRDTSDVAAEVNVLDTKLDGDFVKLDVCVDADCTESICLDVDAALDLSTKNIGVLKGLVTPDLGQGCADIVAKIGVKLSSHKTSCDAGCGDYAVYSKVDKSLSSWLKQVEVSVPGVLAEVKTLLLADVLGLLKDAELALCLELLA